MALVAICVRRLYFAKKIYILLLRKTGKLKLVYKADI